MHTTARHRRNSNECDPIDASLIEITVFATYASVTIGFGFMEKL